MGLTVTSSFAEVFESIIKDTIFKNSLVPFESRIANLPGNATHFFGFENHLGKHNQYTDIAMCFSNDQFKLLANWCDEISRNSYLESYWSIVADIARGKFDSHNRSLNSIWIELDRSESSSKVSSDPGIFIEFKNKHIEPFFATNYVIPYLTGSENHPCCANVELCLTNLPENGFVAHFGYFPSRCLDKIRLTISFDHYDDIVSYCYKVFNERINLETINKIKSLSEFSDFGVLHLDIGAEIIPRVGIEMRFKDNEQNPEYQWRWESIINKLMDRGLCEKNEADKIIGFRGLNRFIDDNSLMPSWYKRYLYYVKAIFNFTGEEKYKAYCAFEKLSPN